MYRTMVYTVVCRQCLWYHGMKNKNLEMKKKKINAYMRLFRSFLVHELPSPSYDLRTLICFGLI